MRCTLLTLLSCFLAHCHWNGCHLYKSLFAKKMGYTGQVNQNANQVYIPGGDPFSTHLDGCKRGEIPIRKLHVMLLIYIEPNAQRLQSERGHVLY